MTYGINQWNIGGQGSKVYYILLYIICYTNIYARNPHKWDDRLGTCLGWYLTDMNVGESGPNRFVLSNTATPG